MKLTLFPSSSATKKQRAKTSEICLVVHDEVLIHAGTSRHCGLAQADDHQHGLDPERLAASAWELLSDSERKSDLLLALPSHEFVATPLELPGVDAKNLANAARLQLPMILPGMTDLLCAAHAGQGDHSDHVPLWLPTARAEALFQAFAAKSLRLVGIVPRSLAAIREADGEETIVDQDSATVTAVAWRQGRVAKWFYLPRAEYEEADFRAQFDADLAALPPVQTRRTLEDWHAPVSLPVMAAYRLVPPGMVQARQQRRNRRMRWLWQGIAGAVVLVFAGLLIGLYRYHERLDRDLNSLRDETLDVSQLRWEIEEIESRIAPIQEFPNQQVVDVLLQLNRVIPEDAGYIQSFRAEDGNVEIEGISKDPARILELLSTQADFLDVDYSCDIQSQRGNARGDKFCITFSLAGIDVKAYRETYFPEEDYYE